MDTRIFSKFVLALAFAVMIISGYNAAKADTEYFKVRDLMVETLQLEKPTYKRDAVMLSGAYAQIADEHGFLRHMDKWQATRTNWIYGSVGGCIIAFVGLGMFVASGRRDPIKAAT